jgi:hypothetical protein
VAKGGRPVNTPCPVYENPSKIPLSLLGGYALIARNADDTKKKKWIMREQTNNTPAESSKPIVGTSCSTPAPVGVTIKTTIERGDAYSAPEIYNVEITLLEIVRGHEAWERVKTQSSPNEPPKAGFEYVLVRIRFAYFRRGRGMGGEAYHLTEGQFAALSLDGKVEYEIPSILSQPQPALIDYTFSPGESREGWILVQVPKDDKKPLLIFKRQNVGGVHGVWGHIWFRLYEEHCR